MADDFDLGAIGLHPGGKPAYPDMAIVAFFAGNALHLVGAAHGEGASGTVGELRPHVALVPVPEAVRAAGHAVEAVVVLAPGKSGEQGFATVFVLLKN